MPLADAPELQKFAGRAFLELADDEVPVYRTLYAVQRRPGELPSRVTVVGHVSTYSRGGPLKPGDMHLVLPVRRVGARSFTERETAVRRVFGHRRVLTDRMAFEKLEPLCADTHAADRTAFPYPLGSWSDELSFVMRWEA